MKSVLITGGTVRLGKAIAERLRAEGWRVITSSHRADAGADIVADLAEPMGAAKLYAAALQLLGGQPPDALVNTAALFVGDEAAVKAVNLEAPKKLTMMMAGREEGIGAVVNILDSAVLGSDSVAVGSDRVAVGSDRVAVGSDKVAVGSDRVAVGSDSVAVGSDSVAVGSDRVSVGSDSVAVGSDRGVLGSDRGVLGSDRVAIGSDSVAVGPLGAGESTLCDPNQTLSDSKRLYLDYKRELCAFTLSSAMMFAATLRVNGVAPGPVLAPTGVHEKAGETLLDRRPTPEDVAAAVAYLLGAESVTGAVIPVDAGQHLMS